MTGPRNHWQQSSSRPDSRPHRIKPQAATPGADRRTAILVLGMHRSGTSATTRAINLLGASLPPSLLAPAADNRLGFWEPDDLWSINDSILRAADASWDDWRPIDLGLIPPPTRERFQGLVRKTLERYFPQVGVFVLKEPRTCRLLPIWLPMVDATGATAKCVVPLRNPLEVAESLKRRNGFPLHKGLLLWLRYILDVEQHTRGRERAFFAYDALLSDWRSVERNLREALGAWPAYSPDAARQIDDFLDTDHRHQVANDAALLDNPAIPDWLKDASGALHDLQSDPDSTGAMRTLDVVRSRFDAACVTFGFAVTTERAAFRAFESEREALALAESERNTAIATLRATAAGLEHQLQDRQARCEDLEGQLQDRQAQFDALAADVQNQRKLSERLAIRLNRIQTGPAWKLAWPLRWLEARLPRAIGLVVYSGRMIAWGLRLKLPRKLKCAALARRLVREGLFDIDWYIAQHPDIALGGYDPIYHWLDSGWKQDRDPNPRFDMAWYRRQQLSSDDAGINPLIHYLKIGRAQGKPTHPPRSGKKHDLDPAQFLAEIATFEHTPVISLLMPTYNTEPSYLQQAADSVFSQLYSRWELIICDDASASAATHRTLSELEKDDRVVVLRNDRNLGISAATNRALGAATGEYVAMLDHDDVLTRDALFHVGRRINGTPSLDAIYSDQDKIDPADRLFGPFFKPDWSPTYLLGVMYVGHLLVVRRTLLAELGGFDSRFDKVQDYELMLRVGEHTTRIAHIPRILYHWRAIPGSVAQAEDAKTGIGELQKEAVNAHLQRRGIQAVARQHERVPHRVTLEPQLTAHPSVTIVIPTKDAPDHISRCLGSLFAKTSYPSFDVILVDNGTTDARALDAMHACPARIVPFHEPFNFSRANNLGVEHATGEIIVLLNNDTEVISPDWIETLACHLAMDQVGAVGPLLAYPDGSIQHAGVVLGLRGTADHIMRHVPMESDGYAGSLLCSREVSAVTGACLCMRKADYVELGRLSEDYACHYQDVDLCLRIRARGQRILFAPRARLYHHESASRGSAYDRLDRAILRDRWSDWIDAGDPYYNPNFALAEASYVVGTED